MTMVRSRTFTLRRLDLREKKDKEVARLRQELAKSKADAAKARKEFQTRAAKAATAAVAQQEEQRAIINRLEAQIQVSHAERAEALRQAVQAAPMDTSTAAPDAAQAASRQGAGSETESLREDLRAAREELGTVTTQSEALQAIIREMRGKQFTAKMRVEHQLVLEHVTALQDEVQAARTKFEALEVDLFAARIAAGLEAPKKKEERWSAPLPFGRQRFAGRESLIRSHRQRLTRKTRARAGYAKPDP